MSHPPGAVVAPPELSDRARALAMRYGLRRIATACSVDRESLLSTIARWPQRISTVALIRTRIDEIEKRGYGAEQLAKQSR